jgi:hypothetical protein
MAKVRLLFLLTKATGIGVLSFGVNKIQYCQ